jgi:alpha-L-fucosidase
MAHSLWSRFDRPTPEWFTAAKLGIFVHWGAYSVPAWAEPTGELGALDDETWFRHNPYAEWYFNSIRIDGSPAQTHHRQVYGGRPYDEFLDEWRAESFDAAALTGLFARAGARYVVPTTKHHDGITLWDAPGTSTRNTVHRGPRRDLVAEFASATRAAGLRFGVYYSGGLDWHVTQLPPLDTHHRVHTVRPYDEAYATYAYLHVKDLIDRYRPDILWNDIEWPDRGKHDGSCGLARLFSHFYEQNPEGVVNDRWGDTHWDFRCSEYQAYRESEAGGAWENTRGLGLSFGYNQNEDASVTLDAHAALKHLVDVVSRGGNLLLNVGPRADGTLSELQRATLEGMAEWMARNAAALHDTAVVPSAVAAPADDPWLRWTRDSRHLNAIIDADGEVTLRLAVDAVDLTSARTLWGRSVELDGRDGGARVVLPKGELSPHVVRFDFRGDRATS